MEYNYDVFISYRHKPLDGAVTQKTFHMVEGYRLPAALKEKGHNIRRVFRDTEELAVSRILTDTIDKALHSCNCLLIVCSTDTPSSEWVDREVAMFIELGRAQKIFPLLISGTPETSFPPSLKRIPDIMDRVMDVRADGNLKQILRREDTEILKIIAEATGVGYEELLREHNSRKFSRFIGRSVAAASAFIAIGAVSLGLMNTAQAYRNRAQAAEAASMEILQELTYGLPDRLTSIPGAYNKITGILQENTNQINNILLLSTDKTSAGMEVAANYEKLATAMSVMGDYYAAAEAEREALTLYDELCLETGNVAPLASAKNNLGKILFSAGRYEEAADIFADAIELQRQLDDPLALSIMLYTAGGNAADLGRDEEVEEYLTEALKLLETQEDSYDVLNTRATAAYNLGSFRYLQGNYSEAKEFLLQSYEANTQLCSMVDSIEERNSMLKTVSTLGLSLTNQGDYSEAEEYLLQAISIAEELAADEANTVSVSNLAYLYNNCGINYTLQQNYADAADYFEQAKELFFGLSQRSDSLQAVTDYAEACMNIGDCTFKLGQYDKTRKSFEEGLEAFASVEDHLSTPQLAEYYAWAAYEKLICEKDYDTSLSLAFRAYDIQNDSILMNTILGYASLYAGNYAEADYLLSLVASLGEGQADTIIQDLQSQSAAGLYSPHTEELTSLLSGFC